MRQFLAFLLTTLLAACATTTATSASSAAVETTADDSTPWEAEIAAFEREDSVVRRPPGGVVFVGSSSIRMWETLAEDFPAVATINRGFGGSRVRDAHFYADRIVTPYRPRAVVLYAGDNDLFEGRTPEQVRDDFVAFVARVQRSLPQVRIAFIAIKPSVARQALLPQVREANRLIGDYAGSVENVDYLDVFTPMLDSRGLPHAGLFLADGLHMNRAGYGVWVDVVGSWLDALRMGAEGT